MRAFLIAISCAVGVINGRSASATAQAAGARDLLPLMHVPPGFAVDRVAGPPLVEHPVMACFDERGRLFVAENAGVNYGSAELLKKTPSSIRVLEDSHGDGHFDKSSVFADHLTFPEGVAWLDGAVFTASPPSLWRLADTRGGNVADQRKQIVTSFGFTGNAADIHGPVVGPDGWLYWCDGRHGHRIARPDGSVSEGNAARIFRCRPDGSGVEAICGGGMDNPTKVAFTAEGEVLAGVNLIHNKPRRIDGIIFALDGAVFPYYESAISEFKSTGPLFEPVDNLGWVAVSGIVRYDGAALGEQYHDNLFSCQFNPHRVQRHIVHREGAGFRITHEDFLTCSDPDFHPTDIIEDADGSLLVIDTGGWFRIGCPNSRIAKPDITGAIYRIYRKDAPTVDDPRGLKLDWEKLEPAALTQLLGDDRRPQVRERAIERLAHLGGASVGPLRAALASHSTTLLRRNALWALTRIEGSSAREAVRFAMADRDPSVRQTAVHCVSLHADAAALPALLKIVGSDLPSIRREAATALGRIRDKSAVPALLAALKPPALSGASVAASVPDRFLEHSIIDALIQIDDRAGTLAGLSDPNDFIRRGALIALDQMDHGALSAREAAPLLASAQPSVSRAAAQVIARHPDWGAAMIEYFRGALGHADLSSARQEELAAQLAGFATTPQVQAWIAQTLQDAAASARSRRILLEAIAQASVSAPPAAWIGPVGHCIESPDSEVARQAELAARAVSRGKDQPFAEPLLRVARDPMRALELRLSALDAIAPTLKPMDGSLFDLLLSSLEPRQPAMIRSAAAAAIGRANLTVAQQQRVAGALQSAGPLEMPGILAALSRNGDEAVGRAMLDALEHSRNAGALRPDQLTSALEKYPSDVKQLAKPLLARLSPDVGVQKARLDALESAVASGSAARGRALFFGAKAACFTCHTIGDRGGQVGPNLSTIGSIRAPRDLLESIVYPSATIARGYEVFLVKTKDGDVQAGIITRQTADAIYLTTGPQSRQRIARSQIVDLRPSPISMMPQGFDGQLSSQELGDLVAFLASCK